MTKIFASSQESPTAWKTSVLNMAYDNLCQCQCCFYARSHQ